MQHSGEGGEEGGRGPVLVAESSLRRVSEWVGHCVTVRTHSFTPCMHLQTPDHHTQHNHTNTQPMPSNLLYVLLLSAHACTHTTGGARVGLRRRQKVDCWRAGPTAGTTTPSPHCQHQQQQREGRSSSRRPCCQCCRCACVGVCLCEDKGFEVEGKGT